MIPSTFMPATPITPREEPEYEGDYRPADAENPHAHLDPANVRVETADFTYLVQMADALNTTLDLQTLLRRTSELVQSIIHYRIFAILLLNDRTHDLRMRFQIGHSPEVERMRFPLGKGVVGQVALTRQAILQVLRHSSRGHQKPRALAAGAQGLSQLIENVLHAIH